MGSTLQEQTAVYLVEWMKRNGTSQQQYEAERRLRDLRRGTT
jgi:hypothetical protein